jgi:hypothetical protein
MYFCPSLLSPSGRLGTPEMMTVCPCICPSITHLLHHKPAVTGDNGSPQVLFPPCHGGGPQNDDLPCDLPFVCLSFSLSVLQNPAALQTCCDVRLFFVPPTKEMMMVRISFHPCVRTSIRPSHFGCIINLLDWTMGHCRYFLFKSSQVLKKQKTNKLTLKPTKSIYYMLMCDIPFQSSLLRPS